MLRQVTFTSNSTPFEKHLRQIDGLLAVTDAQRRPYIAMMEQVRTWLFQEMRLADRVFDKLCIGPSKYDSYSEWVGVLQPHAFELLCVLEFPFPMELGLDNARPGFVHLDLYGVLEQIKDIDNYEDVYDKLNELVDTDNAYLKRDKFQNWISAVIRKTLQSTHNVVYDIIYKTHDEVVHTLSVRERSFPKRKIEIDVVPVVSFGKVDWMQQYTQRTTIKEDYYYSFYALPLASSKTIPCSTKLYTFLLLNPLAENVLLWTNANLRSAFRLIRLLRDRYELYELKDYMLTNTFLWMEVMQNIGENAVNDILLHTLTNLWTCFKDSFMPFFWVKNCNLLAILKDEEIQKYTKILWNMCEKLTTYPTQRQISLKCVAKHFHIRK